jgi:hypothetical protein
MRLSVFIFCILLACAAWAQQGQWTLLDDFEGRGRLWSPEAWSPFSVRVTTDQAHSGRHSLAVTLTRQTDVMVRATWQTDTSDLRFGPDTRLRFWMHGSKLAQKPHGGLIIVEAGGRKGGGDSHWMLDIPPEVYSRDEWVQVELPPFSEAKQPAWSVDANGKLDYARISKLLFVAQQESEPRLAQPYTVYIDDVEATDVTAITPTIKPASNDSAPDHIRPKIRGFVDRDRAHPAQVRFADVSDWEAYQYGGLQTDFVRSEEEPLFEKYAAKLTYRSADGSGWVALRPKTPIPLPARFNALQMWVFGNNWDWVPDPTTPQPEIAVTLRDATGQEHRLIVGRVNWKFWGLLHKRILPDAHTDDGHLFWGGDASGKIVAPAVFTGIEVRNCGNTAPRVLYFDSIGFYEEPPQIPQYKPIPAKLPFPTTPDTILPTCEKPVQLHLTRVGDAWRCRAASPGDEIAWEYRPRTGTLSDLTVSFDGGRFTPAAAAGPTLDLAGDTYGPADERVDRKLVSATQDGDAIKTRWRLSAAGKAVEYDLMLRFRGKTVIHEWRCAQPVVSSLSLGHATGLTDGKLIMVPYYSVGGAGGAGILYDRGRYASNVLDWYVTEASQFYGGASRLSANEVSYNGGASYIAKTDGQRNPLYERGFLTVSRTFEEVLPNIPNPPTPLTSIVRSYMYTHLGGTTPNRFEVWLEQFRRYRRYGIDKLVVTQHEDSWTEGADVGQGPQEYTMTLDGPPDAGGDATVLRYYKGIRDLGYFTGPYNNYTDYSPLGKSWSEENVTRLPSGEWQRVWPPCFGIRPLKAAEMAARYAPAQAAKFGVNATYCDVHTCIPPWGNVDYQAGNPGAGKFRTTFEAYGRVLMTQRESYKGPAVSEGTHHCFYAGLIDGSYGQMGLPDAASRPLLLDFDLRKMHPLSADVSMQPWAYWGDDEYHCMAQTIAYGHAGFFPAVEVPQACRYYYMIRALMQEYIQVPVQSISYWDGTRFLTASEALPVEANARGQVRVAYRNGLVVFVNVNPTETWQPAGAPLDLALTRHAWAASRGTDFLTYSTQTDGRRVSFARCPDYVFAEAGGKWQDFGDIATDGEVVFLPHDPAGPRLIAIDKTTKVTLRAGRAVSKIVATDEAGKPLGEAPFTREGDRITFSAVDKAVDYWLK